MSIEMSGGKRPAAGGGRGHSSPVHCPPPTAHRHPGFTLVELLVVIAIIGLLTGMLMSGVHMVRIIAFKSEGKMTLKNLSIGITNMKRSYFYDTVLGAYTSGRTVKGDVKFQDSIHDFTAAGANISVNDKVCILAGHGAGERKILAVAAHELTLDGAAFSAGDTDLEYFVIKADGTCWPTVDIVKELDPNNAKWQSTFTPILNGRKTSFFNCKPGRIVDLGGTLQYCDPWRKPYVYRLELKDENNDGTKDALFEKLICSGPDTVLDTKDDIVEEVKRYPLAR